jgi:hypothetical protein
VERESEEPHNGRGIENTGLMVPCKETLVSKGEVFSLDRCPLMGDPGDLTMSNVVNRGSFLLHSNRTHGGVENRD